MLADLIRREERAVRDPKWGRWGTGADIGVTEGNTTAGVRVDTGTALAVSTVYSCVTLRAETLQAMPVRAYAEQAARRVDVRGPRWLDQPNPETSWHTMVGQVLMAIDLHGDAFLLPVRDRSARVAEVWVADPSSVRLERRDGRRSLHLAGRPFPGEWVQVALHRPAGSLRGITPVQTLAETFGLAIAARNYGSSFFGRGSIPSIVLESPHDVTEDQRRQIRDGWVRAHGGASRSQLPGILTGGMTAKPITLPPEQAQFLGSRQFSAAELAAAYKVDPAWIGVGVQGSSLTYQNTQDQYVSLIRRALMSPMRLLEDTFSALMPPAQRMRFVPDVFLKPATTERYAAYSAAIAAGFMTVDEARAFEDWAPLGGTTTSEVTEDE